MERIDSIDDEKMTFTYSVIGGDSMVGLYTKYQATVQIIPKGNGCVAKWAVQYEKVNEDVHDPYAAVDFISGVLHTLDEYVLKNN